MSSKESAFLVKKADSSVDPSLPFGLYCLTFKPYSLIFTTYTIINLLVLLPLCILVLYYGFHRRASSTASTASHSDSYTCHLATMEIIFIIGCVLCCFGSYRSDCQFIMVGFYLTSFTWYGETFFHVMTCVEHYLAVVHPITYLSLKKERWIRIRNIVIGCIWLLCLGGTCLINAERLSLIVLFCVLPLSLIITSFCSLSVVCVLIRPGPGGQSCDRERVEQSKRRAFHIILAILGVLLSRCAWNLYGLRCTC